MKPTCKSCGIPSKQSPCTVCRQLDGLPDIPDLWGNPNTPTPPDLNQLTMNLEEK